MRKFTKPLIFLLLPSIAWIGFSIVYQSFIYNPIGNGYIRFEIKRMPSEGIYFIGPSTFHSRINTDSLSKVLQQPVHSISFDGLNSMEAVAIADYVEANALKGIIVIAGQHMSAKTPGFHNCWACSNRHIFKYGMDSEYFNTCALFDLIAGPVANFAPIEKTREYLDWDEELGIDQAKMDEFISRLERDEIIRYSEFYQYILNSSTSKNFKRVLLVPPNGLFRKCPPELSSAECLDFSSKDWLNFNLWKDGSHVSKIGAQKFNRDVAFWLQALIEKEEI